MNIKIVKVNLEMKIETFLQSIFIKIKKGGPMVISFISSINPLLYLGVAIFFLMVYIFSVLYSNYNYSQKEDLGTLTFNRISIMPFKAPNDEVRFQLLIPSIDGTLSTSVFVSKKELEDIYKDMGNNLKD